MMDQPAVNLLSVTSLGFTDFKYDIRPTGPGDTHKNWIFVEAKK